MLLRARALSPYQVLAWGREHIYRRYDRPVCRSCPYCGFDEADRDPIASGDLTSVSGHASLKTQDCASALMVSLPPSAYLA